MIPVMKDCKTCSHHNADANTCDKNPKASMFGCSLWYPNKECLDKLIEEFCALKLGFFIAVRRFMEEGEEDIEEYTRRFAHEVARTIEENIFHIVAAALESKSKGLLIKVTCEPEKEGNQC